MKPAAPAPADTDDRFAPTREAALARLAAVRPDDYARTRNHLDGAVTRLSPYLTHGLLTLPEALAWLRQRHALPDTHRLVMEFGWRAYFHHVAHHRGESILDDLHPGPLPRAAYADTLPADVREGRTGVPVVDTAVRTLYATGWLHNHARLWLASYVVHLRKVHWRVAADWLYGHLLDGDLCSNHLSWQWVAGTGSHQPYLFDAGNVARFAPPAWHSAGTVVDCSYEALNAIARDAEALRPAAADAPGVEEPPLCSAPPVALATGLTPPSPERVQGRHLRLVHPWSMGERPDDGRVAVGVLDPAFHARFPWSERRWHFVLTRLRACCDAVWWAGPEADAAWSRAASVQAVADPHADRRRAGIDWLDAPAVWPDPGEPCASFSRWWSRVTKTRRGDAARP